MSASTTRRLALLIGLGLLAWAVAMIATLPASRALALFTSDDVRAAGVEGTFWAGRARRVGVGAPAPATGVEWQIAPAGLLTASIAGQGAFDFVGLAVHGQFSRGLGGERLVLRRTTAEGPVDGLAQLARNPLVGLGGELMARVEAAVLDAGRLERLQGRFQWREARLTAPVQLGLGHVRGKVAPVSDGPGHRLELRNQGGDLGIQGSVVLEPSGAYHADLLLTPAADAPAGIADTLRLFARREQAGFRVRHSGRLPLGDGGS
jgi:hypothetical protein